MVVLSKPSIEQFSKLKNPTTLVAGIPLIDLSKPDTKTQLVRACEDFGFFKVVNHGVPVELIKELESEAFQFFSLPLAVKQKAGPPDPFGYGDKKIGPNGDVGWLEYLLLTTNTESDYRAFASIFGEAAERFRLVLFSLSLSLAQSADFDPSDSLTRV